jgi:hypothetical protein
MPPILFPKFSRPLDLKTMALSLMFGLLLFANPVWPQQHDISSMDSMPGMNHADRTDSIDHEPPQALTPRWAGKHSSEFNHHLVGFLVFLTGILVFVERPLERRWPPIRYMWPVCFVAAGLFVLIFSDLEIWPFGPQTPWYALTHSVEDLQHKIFAVILLSLGYVEFQRARGKFKALWTAIFFPVVAIAGAILLLFHVHGGDMTAPHAMDAMENIETQHRWFAATGFGIAIAKGLAEIPQKWQGIFKRAWPALLAALGILLMVYTE